MKQYLTLVLALCISFSYAQETKLIKGVLPVAKRIKLSDHAAQDWHVNIQSIHESPKHTTDLTEKKAMLAAMRRKHEAESGKHNGAVPQVPLISDTFAGNGTQPATPPDNTMAISNAGVVVSCVNTQIMVFDSTGNQLMSSSLSNFANQLGFYNAISDPRVIYDPVQDAFIVLFFSGSSSANSKIIVAFSESNDPTSYWSFYVLSGNLLNDTTWSDYPVVSVTQNDFFVTFNHLQNGDYFPHGFRYSVIWQIDKQSGYNADTIRYNYWHQVSYGGVPVWNIATVQGGSTLSGPNAYFLSVRPSDLTNDSIFLHQISNSYLSGTAQLTTTLLRTSTPYGLSPDAPQVDGQYLATNDARILSAMIENDKIQYVENSIDPAYASAGVYIGSISNVSTAPVATGQIIGYDTIGLGYPSIAYIGNGANDDRAIVTCSYLPAHGYPGTAAIYLDNTGTPSDLLVIKQGQSPVDVLVDTIERWGDYTTIQKRYNVPNTAWLSGSYTDTIKQYQTWIAELTNTESASLGVAQISPMQGSALYPNPAHEQFTVTFDLADDAWCKFTLVDVQGKVVRLLLEDNIDAGTNQFSFSTAYLAAGTYFLHINSGEKNILTKPVVIER